MDEAISREILEYHAKLDKMMLNYYGGVTIGMLPLAKKMLQFELNLWPTWKKLMKKYNVTSVYGIPQDVYDKTCLELGQQALDIWNEVQEKTKREGIENSIVKMKLLFFARNKELIARALKRQNEKNEEGL